MMSLKPAQQRQFHLAKKETTAVARHLLDLEILYLLSPQPKSGYQLKKHLLNSFHINISYGTLYPHLHSLERSKLISGIWNSQDSNEPLKKKTYSLTTAGSEKLRDGVESLAKISLAMELNLAGVKPNLDGPHSIEGAEVAFRTAVQFLASRGYNAKSAVTLRGNSGNEYPVEIYASPAEGHSSSPSEAEKLVLKVVSSAQGASLEDVLRLQAMSYDLDASKIILLSIPSVRDDIIKFAEFCHVAIYTGKDIATAVSSLCSNFEPL